ncbi:cilia- and flagella- associated protein 210 isoform 2-T2 [Rhinophrynus dorsalis]
MATMSAPSAQYGRRKGLNRAQAELVPGRVMLEPLDLRQVTVLPKAEWERLVNYTNSLEKEAKRLYEEKKEREAMHLKSKEVVKQWTNTIAGMRQKKLESKKFCEEKEEEEKKKIDLEEAKYQAERRREAIERARTKQYYQTDKVKKFHSALMLTEVLKEREAQIELKNKMLMWSNRKDKEADMQRKLEESILEDQKRALQRLTDRKNNANEILKQIEERKHKNELEKQSNQREGEEIQRLTREYEWEMNKMAKLRMEEKCNIKMAHYAHLADRNFLRALDKQKEEETDEMIRRFILAKRKMGDLRRVKEEEINRLTVERRDQITDLLATQFKQKVDDEDDRMAKAIADREAKDKKESQEKEEKIKADIKAITEHRLAMRRKKEEEEKREKMKALQELHSIKEADEYFFAQQRDKMRQVEEEHKNVQTIQIQQMAEKKTMSQLEREADIQYAKENDFLLAKEEDQFQEYANQVIDSVTKAGRNPYPLKKAAQRGMGGGHGPVFTERAGIRPSYLVQDTSGVQLPAFQNNTTQQIKEIHDTGDIAQGKRKLGFTW